MVSTARRFLSDSRFRLAVRIAFAAFAAATAWSRFSPPGWRGLLPAASPYVALLSLCAGAGGWLLAGALPVALASLASPRFFCRWLCPAGLCQEAAGGIGRRLPGVRGGAWTGFRIGGWLAGAGAAAALFGYPLFLCLDPLVLFANGWGLALLALLALARPGFWCGCVCPLGALQDLLRLSPRPLKTSASRRTFLRAACGAACGAAYRFALPAAPSEPALRPPCVPGETAFLRLCARCGACVRACPSGILRHGGAGKGFARILAPEVCFGEGVCEPSCAACGAVCPTGAIPRFSPDEKRRRPIGRAVVDPDACLASNGMGCGVCVRSCPFGALDLKWDASEMESLVAVDAGRCTGCGACVSACPADPRAVSVRPLSGGRDEEETEK